MRKVSSELGMMRTDEFSGKKDGGRGETIQPKQKMGLTRKSYFLGTYLSDILTQRTVENGLTTGKENHCLGTGKKRPSLRNGLDRSRGCEFFGREKTKNEVDAPNLGRQRCVYQRINRPKVWALSGVNK